MCRKDYSGWLLGEAEALAWQTGYPHLFFPALATEKVQAAAGWNARQQFIRQQTFCPRDVQSERGRSS